MEKIIRVGKRKNYPKERINKPIDRYFDGKIRKIHSNIQTRHSRRQKTRKRKEKMKLIILIGICILLMGCATGPDVLIPVERTSPDPNTCPLYLEDQWKERQNLFIEVRNVNATTYPKSKDHGYCYAVYYHPDESVDSKFLDLYTGEFGSNAIGLFEPGDKHRISLYRFSENDTIEFRIDNESIMIDDLHCSHVMYIRVPINKSKTTTYNCYFRGELKSSNHTYEELSNHVCDEYQVNCQ